jgi:hypothetical protein
MKQNKQTKENPRWLVACRLPKEKEIWMRLRGYPKNAVFGFPAKRNALAFIHDMETHGVEWALSDARGKA